MTKAGTLMKDIPLLLAFSFGLAICSFMIIAVGATVIWQGSYSFDPSAARQIFGPLVLFWLAILTIARWWKKRKKL